MRRVSVALALGLCVHRSLGAQDSSRAARPIDSAGARVDKGHRVLGVFDALSGVPLRDVDVVDLFVDAMYRTPATGLVGLWVFQRRHDSAVVRVHKAGYRDTAFVVMVGARDTTPVPVFLSPVAMSPTSRVRATDQRGVISGEVVADSTAQGIAGATVTLLDAKRTVLTNLQGEFRFPAMSSGRHVLEVRRVGYAPLRDSVLLPDSAGLALTVGLDRLPPVLDSVLVRATPPATYLRDFEDRRKAGFGRFIDSVELRKHADNRPLAFYLASHFPGLRVTPKKGIGEPTYLSGNRSQCSGKAFSCSGLNACPISLYVDGVPVFIPGLTPGPPDLDDYQATDYAAVEWYPGGATVPEQFNVTGSKCGVMLLWRKR